MPKYDAFGREIGEDTLAGLGGSSTARDQDLERARAKAAPAPAAPGESALPQDAAPPSTQAPAARPGAPTRPVFVSTRASGGSTLRVRRVGLGCLALVILGPLLLGGAGAMLVAMSGGTHHKTALIDLPRPSESPEIAAKVPATPPGGLGTGSLIRRANFARALKRLRTSGLGRLRSLTIRPERIDTELLTKGGRLRSVQVTFDGKLTDHGASGPGFGSLPTASFGSVNTAAPERLVRQAAHRLRRKASSIDYVTYRPGIGDYAFGAYFKGGRIALGDARGNFLRRIS